MNLFSTKTYSFDLPDELIASEPLAKRDASRLLIVNRSTRTIEHSSISELPKILSRDRYSVVVNNTKVFRARLHGHRVGTGGKVEFFLLRPVDGSSSGSQLLWTGLMKTGARVFAGFQFKVDDILGEVLSREETTAGAIYTARFSEDPVARGVGEVPLPPYIVAKKLAETRANETVGASVVPQTESQKLEAYNTTFAKESGSVAAPTAGRHFTPELIAELKKNEVHWNEITLHVGIGTFKPVTTEDIREHTMHAELATITSDVAKNLNQDKREGRKILSVGTTSTRTLESFAISKTEVAAGSRDVNLFIHPVPENQAATGHDWKFVDALLTNFHLPESTLLMMVASFVNDTQWMLEIYQEAIRERYRFYSYGDAMLIL